VSGPVRPVACAQRPARSARSWRSEAARPGAAGIPGRRGALSSASRRGSSSAGARAGRPGATSRSRARRRRHPGAGPAPCGRARRPGREGCRDSGRTTSCQPPGDAPGVKTSAARQVENAHPGLERQLVHDRLELSRERPAEVRQLAFGRGASLPSVMGTPADSPESCALHGTGRPDRCHR